MSCGQQLQREGSYLDRAGARPAGKPKGAVAVAVDAPSLQERQEQLAAAMAGKAALRKPSSRNAKVEEVACVHCCQRGERGSEGLIVLFTRTNA